jgi:hypothetical protein
MRVFCVLVVGVFCAGCVTGPQIAGNDTGGLIDWSPGAELVSEAVAWDYCSKFGRAAYVTRINRRPGDYIAFRCLTYPVDRVTPPVKMNAADNTPAK